MSKWLRFCAVSVVTSCLVVVGPEPGHRVARAAQGANRTLLETTHDACGEDALEFWLPEEHRRQVLAHGASLAFADPFVGSGALRWTCAGSREVTRCPAGTNFVEVLRSEGRHFTVRCFNDPRVRLHLETTEERCSEAWLTVLGRQQVRVASLENRWIPVLGGDITWYCGETRERTGCPEATNAVELEWGIPGSNGVYFRCYNDPAAAPTLDDPGAAPQATTPPPPPPPPISAQAPAAVASGSPTTQAAAAALAPPAPAADAILGFRIVARSLRELTVEVDYTYIAAHGSEVYVGAWLASEGREFGGYAPTRAPTTGQGTARVTISLAQERPPQQSDELRVFLYEPGQAPFVQRRFPLVLRWD